jgi:hypothetical protein
VPGVANKILAVVSTKLLPRSVVRKLVRRYNQVK